MSSIVAGNTTTTGIIQSADSTGNLVLTGVSGLVDLSNNTGAINNPVGTTAQRPVSPIVGAQRWNSTLSALEVYVGGNNWQTIASTAYNITYLVVAGGGAGGPGTAGGGGAGGMISVNCITVNPGTAYPVIVGAGAAPAQYSTNATNGNNSSFLNSTAIGGGRGAGNGGSITTSSSGGSGGGGAYYVSVSYSQGPSSGTSGQGNAGGNPGSCGGGGGGGAGAVGNTGPGGIGGVGLSSSITGTATYYAGGGGGTSSSGSYGGVGGLGGGGTAGNGTATSGAVNTGGGGGGNWGYTNTYYSGGGGSGIVIVRYPGTAQRANGGTVSVTGGYVIHSFTSSGTFTA
jgi:hypothetical protein